MDTIISLALLIFISVAITLFIVDWVAHNRFVKKLREDYKKELCILTMLDEERIKTMISQESLRLEEMRRNARWN